MLDVTHDIARHEERDLPCRSFNLHARRLKIREKEISCRYNHQMISSECHISSTLDSFPCFLVVSLTATTKDKR